MNRKHWNTFIAAPLMAVSLFTFAVAQGANRSRFEPLTIQEQGSFAVGSKLVTAPGTFDPIKQGNYDRFG